MNYYPENVVGQLQEAINWVAAEFKYLKELHEVLGREHELFRSRLAVAKGKKFRLFRRDPRELLKKRNLKQALHVARYIGKAERRAEQKLDQPLAEILSTLDTLSDAELRKTIQQVEVPRNFLVRESSRYVGSLRKGLKRMSLLVAIKEKYQDQSLESQLQQELSEVETEVGDLTRWVSSLEVGLEHLKDMVNTKGYSRRGFLKLAGATAAVTLAPKIAFAGHSIVGKKAEPFRNLDINPRSVTWKRYIGPQDYKGRIILLNVWATYCRPCREELPLFEKLYQKYRERVQILALSVNSVPSMAERYVKEEVNASYPILSNEGKTKSRKLEGSGEVILRDAYGFKSESDPLPITFIIGRDQRIIEVKRGKFSDFEELKSLVGRYM